MRTSTVMKAAVAVLAAAGASLGTAGVASAAPDSHGPQDQVLECSGLGQVTIRTSDNNSSDQGGWSAAQIVDGGSGTLVPVTFGIALHDDTTNQFLGDFTQVKGSGHANQHQSTVTCTQTQSGTIGDLVPADAVPPGVSTSDDATFTLTVTAVYHA